MMTIVETIHLEHLPPGYDVHLSLFSPITNASFLHQQLLAGNSDFEYAFVDASIVVSKLHILAAVYRAINDSLQNRLKTRNVHAEIVLSLSPSNNIAESFRRFGITPTTTSVLAVKVSTPSSPFSSTDMQAHLTAAIEGTQLQPTDDELIKLVDVSKVNKYYKLNSSGSKKKIVNGSGGMADINEAREREIAILGCVALRGAS